MASYEMLPVNHATLNLEEQADDSELHSLTTHAAAFCNNDAVTTSTAATRTASFEPYLGHDDSQSTVTSAKTSRHEDIQELRDSFQKKLERIWTRFSASVTNGWALEIASLLLSIALLAALAGLFVYWSGKPTSTWVAQLSLPTVVVILATASNAALSVPVASCLGQLGWLHFHKKHTLIDLQYFDAASRSPWGTMRLLFTVANRGVFLGFLTVAIGLGFGAAAQQCLQVLGPTAIPVLNELRRLNDTAGNAAILPDGLRSAAVRSLSTKYADTQAGQQIPLIQLKPGATAKTQAVPPATLDYRCGTADCSPRPYATLDLCPSCDDISDQLIAVGDISTCHETTAPDGGTGCFWGDPDAYVYLPDGTLASYDQNPMLLSHPIEYDLSESFKGDLLLADFSMIEALRFIPAGKDSLDDIEAGFVAHRCSIRVCTNIYHLDVSAGNDGKEILLASITSGQRGESNSQLLKDTFWTFPVPDKIILTYSDGSTGHWKGQPAWASKYAPPQGIDYASLIYLSGYFGSLFNGTADQTWNHNYGGGPIAPDPASYAEQANGVGFWNSLQYIFNSYYFTGPDDASAQIEGAVANIVTSMANFLRDWAFAIDAGRGSQYANYYYGLATNTFHVRWYWFVVPVAVEILALLLLIETMLATRRTGAPIWKTSMLPVMLRGIIDDAPAEHAMQVSELAAWAETKRVEMRKASTIYRLVTASDDADHSTSDRDWADSAMTPNPRERDSLVLRARRTIDDGQLV